MNTQPLALTPGWCPSHLAFTQSQLVQMIYHRCAVSLSKHFRRVQAFPPPPSEALPGLTQVPEASWIEASASQALQASATSLGLYGSPLPPLALSGIFP